MRAHTHMYLTSYSRIRACSCSCPPMATNVAGKLTLGSYYDPTLLAQVPTQPQGSKPYRTIYLVATSIALIGMSLVVVYFRMGAFRLRYFVLGMIPRLEPVGLTVFEGCSVGAKCSRYCAGHTSVIRES